MKWRYEIIGIVNLVFLGLILVFYDLWLILIFFLVCFWLVYYHCFLRKKK